MRLIDADRFVKQMNEELFPELIKEYGEEEAIKGLHFSFQDCIYNIECQPTVDAVEVVRCKDCKHYCSVYADTMGGRDCLLLKTITKADDYCSYGERKEE